MKLIRPLISAIRNGVYYLLNQSRAYTEEIDEEIRSIEAIYKDIVQGVGFKKIHVREKLVTPLKDKKLTRDVLANYFEIESEFNGVAFSSINGIIRNGFAVKIQYGWILWDNLPKME
ncbi:MAG: hypothetical protein GY801_08280 [bacterium]|nr:hypothetical protein [bacterium]